MAGLFRAQKWDKNAKVFPLERELKNLPTHHGVVKKGTSQFISQGKQ